MRVMLAIPPTEGVAPLSPPLALGYVAACLIADDDIEVIVRDYRLTARMPVEEAAAAACSEDPDLIAVAVGTPQLADCLEFALQVKSKEDVVTVLWGTHPTARSLETLAHEGVDAVVVGEAEETISEIARRLADGKSLDDVAGCEYKDGDELRHNRARPSIKDIDMLPFPDRDALQVEDYPLKLHSGELMTTMISSRGCPRKGVPHPPTEFGPKYRVRTPEHVVDELAILVEDRGYRAVFFEDAGFTFDQSRLRRILKLIEARDIVVRWECVAQVDVLAEEDYYRMAHAGCAAIRFDAVTANSVAAEKMNYDIAVAQVRDAVEWCKKAGIRTKGYFLTGLPGETREQIEQTAGLAVDLDLDEAYFSILTPLPGTDLWDVAVEIHPDLADVGRYPTADHFRTSPGQLVFANLSDMAAGGLVEATVDARETFWKRVTRRRQFNERFGVEIGEIIWRFSLLTKFKPVRSVKRALLRRQRPARD